MIQPDATSRQQIDHLLQAAGWQVQGLAEANVHAALGVAVGEFPIAPGHGFADSPRSAAAARSLRVAVTVSRQSPAKP